MLGLLIMHGVVGVGGGDVAAEPVPASGHLLAVAEPVSQCLCQLCQQERQQGQCWHTAVLCMCCTLCQLLFNNNN